MKTILIVNMHNVSRKVHFEAAKKYGARLILVMKEPSWEREYVDVVLDVDTKDLNATVQAVLELSKVETIDGVIPFTEHSVSAAASIAQALNLPFISVDTANRCRNKYLMRKAFDKNNIPGPMFRIAKNLEEAKNIAYEFNYPIILKPLIGGGSLAIIRINNEMELEKHFFNIQNMALEKFKYDPLYEETIKKYGNAILIESYMPGGEVSVEGITVDGETTVLAIHDKRLPMQGPYFEELYFTTPSKYNDEIQKKLIHYTKKANKALGIDMGATHTEFRIDDKGEVKIIETGARIGGGGIYNSVLTSTGVDMVHSIMDISVGKKPNLISNKVIPVGFYNFFSKEEGIITDIKGLDNILSNQRLVELIMYKKIGDRVYMPPNSIAHGHFTVKADTLDEVDVEVNNILNTLEIVVSDV